MKPEQLEIAVELMNEKVHFAGVSKSNPGRPIAFDYKPPIGDGQGYTGLELLLMSLAGCSATTVVYLLRQMRKNVRGLRVEANGIKRDRHPMCFEKIFLEFIVTSDDANDSDIQKVVRIAEESVCPVWAMLKNNVEVVTAVKRIAP